MKKLLFTAIIAVFTMTSMNAQGAFKAGLNLGLPIGDASDFYTFNVGLDINYLFEISDTFEAGVASGFSNSFGDSIDAGFITFDIEDFQYIPLAAAARFEVSEQFMVGADLGYAIGIDDGNDGGFYYRPMVGYFVNNNMSVNLYYTGISADGFDYSTVNLGVMYAF